MRVYSCCIRRSRSSRIACIPRSVSLFSFSRLCSDRCCCCCCSCCCCCARLAPRNHHANVVAVEQNLVQLGHHHTVLAVVGGGEGREREGGSGGREQRRATPESDACIHHTHTHYTHTHTHTGGRERESRRRGRQITYYSFTSSNTMLTNSSNPRSVPAISRSPFIRIHKREPMHLSMSSV